MRGFARYCSSLLKKMKPHWVKPNELYILRLFIVFMSQRPRNSKHLIAFLIYKSDSSKGYYSFYFSGARNVLLK